MPPLGAPPEKTADGTMYTVYITAAYDQPAIVQQTFISSQKHLASWRETILIYGADQGASVQAYRYSNNLTVSHAFGSVEGGGHVKVINVGGENDPYDGTPTDSIPAAEVRLSRAVRAALDNGLLSDRGYPADYVAVAPDSDLNRADFEHGPRHAVVQVGDWRFDVWRNGMIGYARNGTQIYANGDLFSHPFFPSHENFTNFTVVHGTDRIELDPVRGQLTESGINGYRSFNVGHEVPKGLEPYFAAANLAVKAAYDTFQPVFQEYFPGLPKGTPAVAPDPYPAAPRLPWAHGQSQDITIPRGPGNCIPNGNQWICPKPR